MSELEWLRCVDCPWCDEETDVSYADCGIHTCKSCGKKFDIWLNEEGADSFGIHVGDYMLDRVADNGRAST